MIRRVKKDLWPDLKFDSGGGGTFVSTCTFMVKFTDDDFRTALKQNADGRVYVLEIYFFGLVK